MNLVDREVPRVRVMVLDEPRSRAGLVAVLRNLGHDPVEATDNQGAEAILRRDHVEVVFAGWGLPGINGVELCRRMRALERRTFTYFVLMTTRSGYNPSDALIALEAGVDDLLLKPVDVVELRGRLVVADRITSLHRQIAERGDELEQLAARNARAARRDPLTGLWNRQRLTEDVASLESRHDRYGQGYCVALIDVDHFKKFNDTQGHQAGDRVLVTVADVMRSETRDGDLTYRFGGEEFLAVLPDQSPADALRAVGRILAKLEHFAIRHPHPDVNAVVTASAGLAPAPPGRGGFTVAVEAADRALYTAKAAGRNRIGLTSGPNAEATVIEWGAIH